METKTYKRKSFEVDAVQATEENLEELALWCHGEVQTDSEGRKFVKVKVHRPMNRKQTEAYPGDWVLLSSTGFKVYPDKAFQSAFEEGLVYTEEDAKAQLGDVVEPGGNIFEHAEHVDPWPPQELRVVNEPAEEKSPEDDEIDAALKELESAKEED